MENQTIKLERFKQAVFEDAEKQAKLITEAADKQRENELAQAKIEAQSLADSKKAAADKTEEARAVREISSKQLEAKRNVLCHREKLIDSVFDNVKSRLATFKASRDYNSWLKEKAEKCKQTYPEHKGIIYLSPEDMKYASDLLSELLSYWSKYTSTSWVLVFFDNNSCVFVKTDICAVCTTKTLS